jgi:predicted transcriptional regulator of viral defense system
MPRKRRTNVSQRALQAARRAGIVRPRDLDRHGVSRAAIAHLVERGVLRRLGRGLYAAPDAELTEHHSLAEAAKRVPRGVVCLLSALRFHGLTTQNPFEVWIAIGHKAWHGSPTLRSVWSCPARGDRRVET